MTFHKLFTIQDFECQLFLACAAFECSDQKSIFQILSEVWEHDKKLRWHRNHTKLKKKSQYDIGEKLCLPFGNRRI